MEGKALDRNRLLFLSSTDPKNQKNISSLAIQVHRSSDAKISDLKDQLLRAKPEESLRFGPWTAHSFTVDKGCYDLRLTDAKTRAINEYWCFGKSQAFVLVESGSDRITDPSRRSIQRALRGWAFQ
jgi:hypothetical protein